MKEEKSNILSSLPSPPIPDPDPPVSMATLPAPPTPLSLPEPIVDEPMTNKTFAENENPNEAKTLSYSEVIQEANKLLAAEEPLTPVNHPLGSTPSSNVTLSNPTASRLTKPIATVSPLHTSKTSNHRSQEKFDDEQLIDLSKSNLSSNDPPLKVEEKTVEPIQERKKRARQVSSSTTRTKVSRHSNKSNPDDQNDSNKSLKKTLSNMNANQYLPSTSHPTPQHQQQMFQNFFHSFQNQHSYWPMSPWPVPPSLALMADPRNYYSQAWPPAPPATPTPSMHPPKDLSSVSLNDFIAGESHPTSATLLNCASNFTRTTSSQSLHLHHTANRHRTTAPLNGPLS